MKQLHHKKHLNTTSIHLKCAVQTDGDPAQVTGFILWIVSKHFTYLPIIHSTVVFGLLSFIPIQPCTFSFIDIIPSSIRRGIRFQILEYTFVIEFCMVL